MIIFISSCASTQSTGEISDPMESMNRGIYSFNETLDKYIAKPIAETYLYTPSPIRTGINNFFNNVDDVITVLNDILQLKLEQSLQDSMRIITNTTFGVFGIFDIATKSELPRHNERFADTLGYWGVGSGPYLVLPILGPSSLRDAPSLLVDIYSYPLTYVSPVIARNSLVGLRMVDKRANLLEVTELTEDVALDPYTFTRDVYYQWRQNQIYDGNPPEQFPQDFDSE
jgi:phospholipid-binding lipoprotein MlaA